MAHWHLWMKQQVEKRCFFLTLSSWLVVYFAHLIEVVVHLTNFALSDASQLFYHTQSRFVI